MDFFDTLRIGSSGLSAQRFRMGLIAGNIANANTTRVSGGGPYRRKDPVFAACPLQERFSDLLGEQMDSGISEVRIAGVAAGARDPVLKFDPGHPDADANGYVAYPDINVVEEMVNMMSAARGYEANVTAIQTTKQMVAKALEIGK